jgi:hypothetical protein
VSTDLPGSERLRRVEPDATRVLRVETVFRVADELHGQTVAAKMIDRAHEIANLPECECDVDVSVEWLRSDGSAGPSGMPIHGHSADPGGAPTRGHTAER